VFWGISGWNRAMCILAQSRPTGRATPGLAVSIAAKRSGINGLRSANRFVLA
jgi:hypothetical protein